MVRLQIIYLAQDLVALGFDGEGEQLQGVWTGLYLFPCLWAVTVCTALSVSYASGNECSHKNKWATPFVAGSQNAYKEIHRSNIYNR